MIQVKLILHLILRTSQLIFCETIFKDYYAYYKYFKNSETTIKIVI